MLAFHQRTDSVGKVGQSAFIGGGQQHLCQIQRQGEGKTLQFCLGPSRFADLNQRHGATGCGNSVKQTGLRRCQLRQFPIEIRLCAEAADGEQTIEAARFSRCLFQPA